MAAAVNAKCLTAHHCGDMQAFVMRQSAPEELGEGLGRLRDEEKFSLARGDYGIEKPLVRLAHWRCFLVCFERHVLRDFLGAAERSSAPCAAR
jgi:hypothetical protein